MCRIFDWPRLNLPVPVFLKRLAAPRCVLSLGMVILTTNGLLTTAFSLQERRRSVQSRDGRVVQREAAAESAPFHQCLRPASSSHIILPYSARHLHPGHAPAHGRLHPNP